MSENRKKRVAVIFGGQSSEHEISRVSAQSVVSRMDPARYDVVMIGITKDGRWLHYDGPVRLLGTGEWQEYAEQKALTKARERAQKQAGETAGAVRKPFAASLFAMTGIDEFEGEIDVAFPVLHGINGEDGTIQGLFELAGIPYVGCGVLSSALGMDKAYAKILFEIAGIPQCKHLVFSRRELSENMPGAVRKAEEALGYPCFVKPSNAGSSVGVSKARNRDELESSLAEAARYDHRIIVEEFIDGREIECAVLGYDRPEASVLGEVVPCNEFYDYEAKYKSGDSSEIKIPAPLPDETAKAIREYAVRAFKALDCSGLARVDFFVHKKTGGIYINEINTMPGFTSISMYPKLWEATGLPYDKLVDRLIELAVERFEGEKRCVDT
jgi:D-alanine-D-alanine ligase